LFRLSLTEYAALENRRRPSRASGLRGDVAREPTRKEAIMTLTARLSLTALLALLPLAAGAEEDLEALLDKASTYVAGYEEGFSAVVAEEDYMQYLLRDQGSMPIASRSLHSDVLFAPVGGALKWILFRDVYEVDGKAVRDREGRLEKLWLESHDSAIEQCRAILQESARYNLGRTVRNFNIPTLPLLFVHPDNRHRFEFELDGDKKVEERRCGVVDYHEVSRPTLIREEGQDVFTRGSLYVEESDGAILKTEFAFDSRSREGRVRIWVSYRWVEEVGMWLPQEMNESYESTRPVQERHRLPGSEHLHRNSEFITCKAKYKNYRSFKVQTEERYRLPE
jgi:hypothetical protein